MNEPPVKPERRQFITWLWRLPVLVVVGGALFAFYEAYKILFTKAKPKDHPVFVAKPPVKIADLTNFRQVWDSTSFILEATPGIAIQIPEATSGSISQNGKHYAAFSRICTHQGCIVGLNKNTEALAVAYNYRTQEPALACPCHFSVYLPTEAGKAVSGPAVKPLARIQLDIQEDALYAVGLESPQT